MDIHLAPSIRSSFSAKLLFCVILTLVVIYSHRFLPERHLILSHNSQVGFWLYGDSDATGKPLASWVDEKGLEWVCDIPPDGNDHHVCGLGFAIGMGPGSKGLDISMYDRVNFYLDYEGKDERARLSFRNFAEGFSSLNDINSSPFINYLIPAKDLNKPLSIELSKFVVAEWWISQQKAPLNLMSPSFDHAFTFGIDLHYPTFVGRQHYKLHHLEFVGRLVSAEHWYLGILVFWMSAIVVGGGFNLWRLRQQFAVEHVQLEALIQSRSKLESETKHYRELSLVDKLTGLANRNGLAEYIDKNFSKDKAAHCSLIVFDIDFFKRVNDRFGHSVGDFVLQTVAAILRENRGKNDYAARWGGEEFVMIMPNTPLQEAFVLAEIIRTAVQDYRFIETQGLAVTVSAGVGEIAKDEPFHKLFRRVDLALYRAKENGRNRSEISS